MSLFPVVLAMFAVGLVSGSGLWYVKRVMRELAVAEASVDSAWSNVDVLLQRRYDEIGTLVDLAAQYLDREREVLQDVIEARQAAIEATTPSEQAEAQITIRESLGEIQTLAEEYPELRDDESFQEIQNALQKVEQRLENRREYYNESVRRYNALLKTIPHRWIASSRGLEPREHFVADEGARDPISIDERFHKK